MQNDGLPINVKFSPLQFCQWALYNPGKQLEFPIHEGATGPFVMSGYGGYKQQQSPRGKLFAFDSGGKYILTCAPYGGIIYEVSTFRLVL